MLPVSEPSETDGRSQLWSCNVLNTAVNGIFLIDLAAHLNGLPNTDICLKKIVVRFQVVAR